MTNRANNGNSGAARRTAGAAIIITAAWLTASCGKPPEPAKPLGKSSVTAESGALPSAGMGRRLAGEQSLFLRNHAEDPVDWYPWGEEAFARAARENKQILLSIGYFSCPWSRRMQTESFADPAVARFMNSHFINVLVDREEWPEVNNVLLQYVFSVSRGAMSGWPLHVWLTPRGHPCDQGIYFPPAPQTGSPETWRAILERRANEWEIDSALVTRKAEGLVGDYKRGQRKLWSAEAAPESAAAFDRAFEKLSIIHDPVNGGFTKAPKFPQPAVLDFLLTYARRQQGAVFGRSDSAREMVGITLDHILRGGIVDQLGDGLHRYSTDSYWAVPQFEKMAYDQGLMAGTLLRAAAELNQPRYADAARRLLAYADRTLSHPDGGFYCAQASTDMLSADPEEQVEGAYYFWTMEEIRAAAPPETLPVLTHVFALGERGNLPIDSPMRGRFPNQNLPRREKTVSEAAAALNLDAAAAETLYQKGAAALLEARGKRPAPGVDRKILTSWNGALISSFVAAGVALDDPALTARGARAAEFILKNMMLPDGSLAHAFLDARSAAPGCSEDYGAMVRALLDLHEATGATRWLDTAVKLQDKLVELLWDDAEACFYDTVEIPHMILRMRSVDESSELAPMTQCVANLARLAHGAGRPDYLEKLKACRDRYAGAASRAPAGFLRFLTACDVLEHPPLQIFIDAPAGSPAAAALVRAASAGAPAGRVIVFVSDPALRKTVTTGHAALEAALAQAAAAPRAVVCRNHEPIATETDPAALRALLEKQ